MKGTFLHLDKKLAIINQLMYNRHISEEVLKWTIEVFKKKLRVY